ncbi:MAG: HDOD domain-containing protein [Nitrosomonadales bacterium]
MSSVHFSINFDKVVIPPCPVVVMGMLREMKKEEPDLERVVALISRDPALTISILKTVNSPLFGYARKVIEVRNAVMTLGLNKSMSIAMACKVQDLGRQNVNAPRVWEHSRKVAEISAKLFKHAGIRSSTADTAYTAGLLHDVGIFLLLDQSEYSDNLMQADLLSDAEASNHSELGALILEKWGMPDIVSQATRYHHAVESIPDSLPIENAYMAAVVNLAERVECLISSPFQGDELMFSDSSKVSLELLGISEDDFIDIQSDLLGDVA